jgi:plasmid stabilization system protein ParE
MSRRRRFVLTPEAHADVIEIWNYIAEDSIDRADQVLAKLYHAFTRLGGRRGWATTGRALTTLGTFPDGSLLRHRLSLGNHAHTDRRGSARCATVGDLVSASDSMTSRGREQGPPPHFAWRLDHSCRSAVTGLIRIARAGIQHAPRRPRQRNREGQRIGGQ